MARPASVVGTGTGGAVRGLFVLAVETLVASVELRVGP